MTPGTVSTSVENGKVTWQEAAVQGACLHYQGALGQLQGEETGTPAPGFLPEVQPSLTSLPLGTSLPL